MLDEKEYNKETIALMIDFLRDYNPSNENWEYDVFDSDHIRYLIDRLKSLEASINK